MLDINSKKYPYLKAGDFLIVHHNFFLTDPDMGGRYIFEHDLVNEIALFSIPVTRNVYARITGEELEPVCENMICERIVIPHDSVIERPFDVYYDDRVTVIKTSPEIKGIRQGDVIAIHKYGDMELIFNINNKERRAIKVWQDDAVGFFSK